MAKFAFLFIFSISVLQSLNATPLTNKLDLLKESNEIKDIINEVNKVVTDASTRESALRKKLNNEFTSIETAADFPGLMDNLKQNITQTLVDGGNAIYVCNDDAWKGFEEMAKLTSVEHCKSQIEDEVTDFKKQIKNLVSTVQNILKKISEGIEDCVYYNSGNYQKYIACIQRLVAVYKERLKVQENAIQETFKIIEAFVPIYTNMMGSCVNDIKQKFNNKMADLIRDVQLCIKNN